VNSEYTSKTSASPNRFASIRPPNLLRNAYAGEFRFGAVTPAPDTTTSREIPWKTHAFAKLTSPNRSTASGSPFEFAVAQKMTIVFVFSEGLVSSDCDSLVSFSWKIPFSLAIIIVATNASSTVPGFVTSTKTGSTIGLLHGTTVGASASSPSTVATSNKPLRVPARTGMPRFIHSRTHSFPVRPDAPMTSTEHACLEDDDAAASSPRTPDVRSAHAATRHATRGRGRRGGAVRHTVKRDVIVSHGAQGNVK
tara:strand:- start:6083 stop:6838 length:756 start_codon:yes stop_codon:yes gene_type:complete